MNSIHPKMYKSLKVLDGGLLTTVQDRGRFGYRKYGVPVSGVMDEHAFKLVNWLVGNSSDSPVLEMTLKGGAYEFQSDATIGLAGAEAEVLLNGKKVPFYETVHIQEGDVLEFDTVNKGCRVYLAIRGKWNLPEIMKSYSTCLTANFGGLEGRLLKKGDVLEWQEGEASAFIREVPKKWIPHYSARQLIRIIEGPEWNWLSRNEKDILLSTEFDISADSNRMGIRLKSSVKWKGSGNSMKSAPVLPGTVQLPPNGNPIILMKDAQSVGGYPRVAKVADADLWRLAQLWHPTRLRFKKISLEEAINLSAFHKNLLL